jgi:hypothetical protein
MVIGALARDVLMGVRQQGYGLLAPIAALPAVGDAALHLRQPLCAPAVVAWMLHRLPIGRDQEHSQPHIYAGFPASERQ